MTEILSSLDSKPDDAADNGGSLHETIVTKLRNLFLEGELPSGSRIPEAALCQRFSVSRTPLREALKALAVEGFVILRPNRGAIVAPVDAERIQPIFEVKGALERLIGLTAAERATDEDIHELETLHLMLGEVSHDHAAYTRQNYQFHRRLALASGNPILIQHYDMLQQQIWCFRFAINISQERLTNSFAEHERIIVALRARARLDLAERLEEHNRLTCEAMMAAFNPPPPETRS